MNRNEILNNIKDQFKKLMFAETSPATMQITTNDNKNFVVMGEELAVGCEIYELNADNTQTPVNDGDYTLSDGRMITVSGGKVSDIKAPDAAQQTESPVEPAKMEMSDGMPDNQLNTEGQDPEEIKDGADMEARVSALEQQIQELMQMMAGSMSQTEKMMNTQVEMSNQLKRIAEEPGGNKVNLKKVYITDKQTIANTTMDEIRDIAKKMNSVKY